MTPDKIRAFLKVPTGGRTVHLMVSALTGMQELASWERQEVEDTHGQTDGDVADSIIKGAQEYANGETKRQKFRIQWRGLRAKPLKSTTHWATPQSQETSDEEPAGISDATVIRELLKANGEAHKLILGALPPLHSTIQMLSARLSEAYEALDDKRVPAPDAVETPRELSDEELAEVLQRTEALGKVMDKVPDILDVGIAALSKWALSDRPSTSNGASKPGVGETRVEPPPSH